MGASGKKQLNPWARSTKTHTRARTHYTTTTTIAATIELRAIDRYVTQRGYVREVDGRTVAKDQSPRCFASRCLTVEPCCLVRPPRARAALSAVDKHEEVHSNDQMSSRRISKHNT